MNEINYILNLGNDNEDLLLYFTSSFNFQINDELDLGVFDELDLNFFNKVYKIYNTSTFVISKRWVSFDDNEITDLNKDIVDDEQELTINIGKTVFVNLKLNPKN